MSYSNDWSISGTSAISSLKDCYQWNEEKRIYKFPLPTLLDGTESGRTGHQIIISDSTNIPINIVNGSLVNKHRYGGSMRYYAIPGYLIQGKNIQALGDYTGTDNEEKYNHTSMTYNTSLSPSTRKNWQFLDYFATVIPFLDCFSQYQTIISPSSIVVTNRIVYDNSSIPEWVVQPLYSQDTIIDCLVASYEHTSAPAITTKFRVDLHQSWGDPLDTEEYYTYRDWEWKGDVIAGDVYYFSCVNQTSSVNAPLTNQLFYKQGCAFYGSMDRTDSTLYMLSLYSFPDGGYVYVDYFLFYLRFDLTIQRWLPWYTQNAWSNIPSRYSYQLGFNNYADDNNNNLCFNITGSCTVPFNYPRYNWDIYLDYDGPGDVYIHSSYLGRVRVPGSEYVDDPYWYLLDYKPSDNFTFNMCDLQSVVVLSTGPVLSFKKQYDSRNNNSVCYKVYYSSFVADISNTGGTITLFAYIYGNPEQISLTLSSDSGTTSTLLSNGGRIYWDGVSHGQVTDGCLVYEGPGDTWGSWQGFGSVVNLAPVHGVNPWNNVGGIYFESTGGSSTDSDIYYIDFPRGFITSYSGYRINNYIRTNISDTISSSAVREDVYSTENQYNDLQYIEVTAVGVDGNTKTMTYGSIPSSPTFRQTTIGGGSNVRFGWNPPSGSTIYGIMTLIVSIDGVQSTYTDSSAVSISSYHYKQYVVSTPTGDRDVECLYSELRWGGDANHLDYVATWGTRP